MRRRCEALAAELPIPVPFCPAAFVEAIAAHRGRHAELVPVTSQAPIPTGMVVSTDSTDYIFYAADTTELHQWHIVAHEVGHLVCGHRHVVAMETAVANVLMPNLSLELVRRVLGRTVPDDAEELQAELLAYAILRRALRAEPRRAAASSDLVDGLDRLASVLRSPRRRPER